MITRHEEGQQGVHCVICARSLPSRVNTSLGDERVRMEMLPLVTSSLSQPWSWIQEGEAVVV